MSMTPFRLLCMTRVCLIRILLVLAISDTVNDLPPTLCELDLCKLTTSVTGLYLMFPQSLSCKGTLIVVRVSCVGAEGWTFGEANPCSGACVNGSEACVDNSEACANSSEACVNGSETCADGSEACVNGSEACGNGSEACGDGSETCADGSEACVDGSETCVDGSEACVNGSEACGWHRCLCCERAFPLAIFNSNI